MASETIIGKQNQNEGEISREPEPQDYAYYGTTYGENSKEPVLYWPIEACPRMLAYNHTGTRPGEQTQVHKLRLRPATEIEIDQASTNQPQRTRYNGTYYAWQTLDPHSKVNYYTCIFPTKTFFDTMFPKQFQNSSTGRVVQVIVDELGVEGTVSEIVKDSKKFPLEPKLLE